MDAAFLKKIKLKQSGKVLILHSLQVLPTFLYEFPKEISLEYSPKNQYDWILLFAQHKKDLEQLSVIAFAHCATDGLIWMAFPKGAKMKSDLSRDKGWESIAAKKRKYLSLVSLDNNWSAFGIQNTAGTPWLLKEKENLLDEEERLLIDYENKKVQMPLYLLKALNDYPMARSYFESLAFSHKKEYVLYICDAKQEKTKIARTEKVLKMLLENRKNPSDKS